MDKLKTNNEKIFDAAGKPRKYKALFGKTFENYLDDVKDELFDFVYELATNAELLTTVRELAHAGKVNESFTELNENFFDLLKQRYDKAKQVVSNLSDKGKEALQSLVARAKDIMSFIGSIGTIIKNAFKDITTKTFEKLKKSLASDKKFTDKIKELYNAEKDTLVKDLKVCKDVVSFYKNKFVDSLTKNITDNIKPLLVKNDLPVMATEAMVAEGNDNVISKLLGNVAHIPPFSWLHDLAHLGQTAANKVIAGLSKLTQNLGGPAFTLPVIAILLGIAFEYNVKGLAKHGLLHLVAEYSIPFVGVVINVIGIIATFLAAVSVIDSVAGTNIIAKSGHDTHGETPAAEAVA